MTTASTQPDDSSEGRPGPARPGATRRPRGRTIAARSVTALVLIVAAVGGWALGAVALEGVLPGQVGLYGDALARVPEAPPPTTTTSTTTTTTPGVEPPPIVGTQVGWVRIPRFGVNVPLIEGIDLWVIDQGSGHWPGSSRPGERGNLVVAGHRTLYQRPFHDLDQLVAGDRVEFEDMTGAVHVYEVRGVIIVPENAVAIANQNEAHTATLFACHPKGSATHRIVAKLRMLGPDGRPVDAEHLLPPLNLGMGQDAHLMQVEPGMAPPPP